MEPRTILHVDLDAFFAAVEQRDRPELRGKPVVVGGGGPNERGVVSAASYEARAFGVHSAMPLRQAGRLCPQAVFLPVDGTKYQSVSRDVMAILRRFTPLVEPISIDEAFLDVTGSEALCWGPGERVAQRIRDAISQETQLTASVGRRVDEARRKDRFGPAEAGRARGRAARFRGRVPRAPPDCPPLGRWSADRGRAARVRRGTIGELAALPDDLLVRRFGKHGASLHERALGIDDDPVAEAGAAKSVSHEHTFDVDTNDRDTIERTLLAMADGVAGRLRSAGLKASTVSVKIRDSSFRTITRQRTLPAPTDLAEPIWHVALELARPEVRGLRIRLLGVSASGLGERDQLALFGADDPRRRRVVEAADSVRHRFGEKSITRARLLGARLPAPFERDPSEVRALAATSEPAPDGRDTQADTDGIDDLADDA